MKTYRIYGLVLAVFCCMTMVIAAAGAAMAPAQGIDQAQGGPPHGYIRDPVPGNMSEHQGNFTSPPPVPENRTGNWTGPGNMSEHQGNFTSPPPMPENRTGNWTGPGNTTRLHQGNLTVPLLGRDHRNWSGNESDQGRAINSSPEYGQQQSDKDSMIEAFITWLRSNDESWNLKDL